MDDRERRFEAAMRFTEMLVVAEGAQRSIDEHTSGGVIWADHLIARLACTAAERDAELEAGTPEFVKTGMAEVIEDHKREVLEGLRLEALIALGEDLLDRAFRAPGLLSPEYKAAHKARQAVREYDAAKAAANDQTQD